MSVYLEFDDIIRELICPITQDFMRNPATIESGHSYDR